LRRFRIAFVEVPRKNGKTTLAAGIGLFPNIPSQMIESHWRDAVRELADRVGAGGPTKLTDAVLAGSQEDARLLSNFMAEKPRQTTDDLLKQIRDILAARLGRMGEPMVADFGGGGDF
jgi:hypothetical protein